MPFSHINGIDLYYETAGSGPPLVFAHGGFGGLGTGMGVETPAWRDRVAGELQVITFDRRSAGRSSYPTTPHSLELFADDVRALLDQLGLARTALWGISAGGPIALTYALRYPETLNALIVSDSRSWFFREGEQKERLRERIALLEREGPEAAYAARRAQGTVGLNVFSGERPALAEDERQQREQRRLELQQMLAAVPHEERVAKYAGELRTYAAYVDYDVSARLRSLTMPVLIIHPTGDTIFPEPGWEKLTAGMLNVSYMSIPGEHGAGASDPASLDAIVRLVQSTSGS